MIQQAILLNGPSSSGKSTLAKALQEQIRKKLAEYYEVVSIDDFMKISTSETIYEDDVFEISGDLCNKALEALKTGCGVIVDHVITSERIYRQFMETLCAYTVRTVRVECPLEILRKREQERGDRHPGSAEASDQYLYPKTGYEISVNTGERSAREISAELFENLFYPDRSRSL